MLEVWGLSSAAGGAGFYYVELSRADGAVTAYYCDQNSAPFQKLDLKLAKPGPAQQCSSYEFS